MNKKNSQTKKQQSRRLSESQTKWQLKLGGVLYFCDKFHTRVDCSTLYIFIYWRYFCILSSKNARSHTLQKVLFFSFSSEFWVCINNKIAFKGVEKLLYLIKIIGCNLWLCVFQKECQRSNAVFPTICSSWYWRLCMVSS